MRRLILFIFLFISTLSYSVPAKHIKKTISVDGKQIEVTFTGNEKVHFWLSKDGKKYRQDENGKFSVFDDDSFNKALKSPKFRLNNVAYQQSRATGMARARSIRKAKYQGERHGLLILVNFADKAFVPSLNILDDYKKIASGINYTESDNYGSVRDYFRAQSYGQFDYVLDVVGPVTLSHDMKYYGENDLLGQDKRPGSMIWEACKGVEDQVDFRDYDWDGDGVVEQVFVLYAGYGEAQSYIHDNVWPHSWSLKDALNQEHVAGEIPSCVFDGVTVDTYACSCELQDGSGLRKDGIGTMCHELSHCFGLPDLYNVDEIYDYTYLTMGDWSVMDNGNYAGDSYYPVSYTAYERWCCGWLEPTELSSSQFVEDMRNIDENGDAYVIYNDGNENEFYILQNIQQTGWNTYSPAHGLLVIHVDYNPRDWEYNTVNVNKSHLRVTPICADNTRYDYNLTGDTYPGITGNTSLTDVSVPAATLYTPNIDGKKLMHKPITEIAESKDGVISFTFMGGFLVEVPYDIIAYRNGDNIDVNCKVVQEEVVSYNIKYGSLGEDAIVDTAVIDENFSKITSEKDINIDISNKLDDYLNTKGFSGEKLYRGSYGLKIGSSKNDGSLTTPVLQEHNGKITMTISSVRYGTDNGTLNVNIYDANRLFQPVYVSAPIKAGTYEKKLEISDIPKEYIVTVFGDKRSYLTKLKIEGHVSTHYQNTTQINGVETMPFCFVPAFAADKYWLQVQAVSSKGSVSEWSDKIIVENGTSKINAIQTTPLHGNVYNLNGQRVGKGYKGIMVRNGRKVLSK